MAGDVLLWIEASFPALGALEVRTQIKIVSSTRFLIAITGILLPYLVRLPRGGAWVAQYTDVGLGGLLFLNACNVIAWGSLVLISFFFRRPGPLLLPCLAGFAFLGWAHHTLDLAADAQAAIALVFIPIYALLPIAIGSALGIVVDRLMTRHDQRARHGAASNGG
jgi:hypothetical protein